MICRDMDLGKMSPITDSQLKEVSAKYDPNDEQTFKRIRLIHLHYNVSEEMLGWRDLRLVEAMTYVHMRRPNRTKALTI